MNELLNGLPNHFPVGALTAPTPRHVVCLRKLEKKKPGMDTPQHAPTVLGAYWKLSHAHLHASMQRVTLRRRGFTVSEIQTEGYPKWEAFKLSPIGDWIMFEIYITTIH